MPRGTLPAIEPAVLLEEGHPMLLATLGDAPATHLYLLFFSKGSVKVGRNHIWRPKPAALASLAEPFRSAMAAGRAGRLPHVG